MLQAYARKLGGCLLEAAGDDTPAGQQLRRWTMELTSLMVCVSLGNRDGFKAFHQANMEDGRADVRELDESFYRKLLVSLMLRCFIKLLLLYINKNIII